MRPLCSNSLALFFVPLLLKGRKLLLVSPCGFSVVQRKLNTPPMTIVMLREESNHDLQHDLGHMEY